MRDYNNHIKGGQGRTSASVEADASVMAFTFALAVCVVLLAFVGRFCK